MSQNQQPQGRNSIDQDQFLTILSREDALARFEAALFPLAMPREQRRLADALGCALTEDVVAPIDVPPFDRSNVDGFAVRSADLACVTGTSPVRLMLALRDRLIERGGRVVNISSVAARLSPPAEAAYAPSRKRL